MFFHISRLIFFLSLITIIFQCAKIETDNIFPPTEQSDSYILEIASNTPDLNTIFTIHRERRLLASVNRYTIAIWDTNNGKRVRSFEKNEYGAPIKCAFSQDGNQLRILTDEKQFLVWDLIEGEQVGFYESVYNCSNNNRYLLVNDSPGISKIVDLDGIYSLEISIPCGSTGSVFSDNNRYFAHVGTCDSKLKIFDLQNGKLLSSVECNPLQTNLALGNTGKVIAIKRKGDLGVDLIKFNNETHNEESNHTFKLNDAPKVMRFTANDNYLCTSSFNNSIKILNTNTYQIDVDKRGSSSYENIVMDSTYIRYFDLQAKNTLLLDQNTLAFSDTVPTELSIKSLSSNSGIVYYSQNLARKNELCLFDFYEHTHDTITLSQLGRLYTYHDTKKENILWLGAIYLDLYTMETIPKNQFYEQHGIDLSKNKVYAQRYSPSFKYYYTEEGVFNSQDDSLVFHFTEKKASVVDRRVYFSSDEKVLLTYNSRAEKSTLINLENGELIREKQYDFDTRYLMAPSGHFYLTYNPGYLEELNLHVISGEFDSPKWQDKYQKFASITSLEISQNEKYIAFFVSEFKRTVLTIWSLQTGELIFEKNYKSNVEKGQRKYNVEFIPNSEDVLIFASGNTLERRNFMTNEPLWQRYPSDNYTSIFVSRLGKSFFHNNGYKYFMLDLNNGEKIWELGTYETCSSCYYVKSLKYPIIKAQGNMWTESFYKVNYPDWTISTPPFDSITDKSNYLARITSHYLSE